VEVTRGGEFWTFNFWELRTGHQGRELEELTRLGIIPEYGKVNGVRAIKLFRVEEGDGVGRFLAVTIYESRDAFNAWFTSNSVDYAIWERSLRPTLEKWSAIANLTSVHRLVELLDFRYE
jgi:heme-degrading monooxygenase HmoA